jgi:hypothetical protein
MKTTLSLFTLAMALLLSCNSKDNAGANKEAEGRVRTQASDTSGHCAGYRTVYDQNGICISVAPNKALNTDTIGPDVAQSMIACHLYDDYDPVKQQLGQTKTRFVDFEIEKLAAILTMYNDAHMQPEKLRIYMGDYDTENAPGNDHIGKGTVILVGVKNNEEIFPDGTAARQNLKPVNIGTLCPPHQGCVTETSGNAAYYLVGAYEKLKNNYQCGARKKAQGQ